jgi:hypothetical protein
MTDKAFNMALGRFKSKEQKRLLKVGLHGKLVTLPGSRYIKIARVYMGQRSAMFFIDARRGNTYGNISPSESWARPRKYFIGNIFDKSVRK